MRSTVTISRPTAEVGFALVLLAIGIYAQQQGVKFGLGTMTRMGSGALPFLVGFLLCINAVWIALRCRGSRNETIVFELRGTVFTVLAMSVWIGGTIFLGLLPAIWLLCFIAALGYAWSRLVSTLVAAIAMSAVAKFLFIDILSVNIPLFRF